MSILRAASEVGKVFYFGVLGFLLGRFRGPPDRKLRYQKGTFEIIIRPKIFRFFSANFFEILLEYF